eukprot:CAMPEP_0184484832 /NCGR_PEP_ID=MMETSP0113_2-20130426/6509_1 /TAXON_ID=91329 /ORGANISM="Norrisiella sphaerica, Strain BC52" /LENGTH=424 /DNA_ID=CAMNT_0026866003 /DNA_START=1 /DNA_END=1275 /DNA_ORIENTATION=-
MVATCGGFMVGSRLAPTLTAKLERFMQPTCQWVSLHLPMLFGPALVMLPTLDLGEENPVWKLLGVIVIGWAGSFVSTAYISRGATWVFGKIQRGNMGAHKGVDLPSIDGVSWMRGTIPFWILLGIAGAPMAYQNPTHPADAFCFTLGLTGGGFALGYLLPSVVRVLLPPLGVSMLTTWIGVEVLAELRDTTQNEILRKAYIPADSSGPKSSWIEGGVLFCRTTFQSGKCLLRLLDASLIIAGIQTYQFLPVIRASAVPLVFTIACAAPINLILMASLSRAAELDRNTAVASLTRGVTTAMALPINKMMSVEADSACDYLPVLTAAFSTCCGLLGAIVIPSLLPVVGIASEAQAAARGLAAGASAHGLGASVFASSDPKAFVFGVVTFGLVGAWSAVLLLEGSPVRSIVFDMLPPPQSTSGSPAS